VILLVVEKAHCPGNAFFALQDRGTVGHFNSVVGIVRQIPLRTVLGCGLHKFGLKLAQGLGVAFGENQ
jgi:hypothetical protein